MQKGRILLSVFSFPLIGVLLLLLVLQANSQNTKQNEKVLGTAHANIQSFNPTTPTISKDPTSMPTKTPTPTKKVKRSVTVIPTISQLNPTDFILEKVNEYRTSLGLSKVRTNSEACNFAKTRAEEISSKENFNHNGFIERVNNKTLPYPAYSEISENIAYNTDYKDVVNRWIASSGHAENMRKNTQFVCIGKFGDYYSYEGWQP